MSNKEKHSAEGEDFSSKLNRRAIEGLFIISIALAAYCLMAFLSYDARDPGWSVISHMGDVHNAAGAKGALIADVAFSLVGYVAYLIPLALLYRAWLFFRLREQEYSFYWANFCIVLVGFSLVAISLCGLFAINSPPELSHLPSGDGGYLGETLATAFLVQFGLLGGRLILFALLFIGLTIFADVSWMYFIECTGRFIVQVVPEKLAKIQKKWQETKANDSLDAAASDNLRNRLEEAEIVTLTKPVVTDIEPELDSEEKKPFSFSLPKLFAEKNSVEKDKVEPKFEAMVDVRKEPSLPSMFAERPVALKTDKTEPSAATNAAARHERPVQRSPAVNNLKPAEPIPRKLPELHETHSAGMPNLNDLLTLPEGEKTGYSEETLQQLSRLLESKLLDFKVKANVTDVLPGPVVTRFELELAPGVKVSTITGLAKDIARSLAVVSVRVVEVIKGKTAIGIEIPNENRQIVHFSEVIHSEVFEKSTSPLTLALGHSIAGKPVIANLAKMPHLLVAGTTGSGKSVGVNAMLLSILFKATPDQVRLILVDPKMLELSVYEGIPHLLTPVITDMKDAANGLRWCVAEMERRYKLLAKIGVRNIAGFNSKIEEAAARGETIADPLWKPEEHFEAGFEQAPAPMLEPLPYVVVVIDEFADMMMVVGKKVEELIARIAQKARAAGIHLILATQRPSVDIITGLIKANVPTRIAFQVSSKIDSRTILDQGGAEQLLGHGDMLFMPPGTSMLTRVHGAFVDDDEVHRVVEQWKAYGEPRYIQGLLDEGSESDIPGIASDAEDNGDPEADPLYDEAVAFVIETQKASISSVQRKLRVGYNRAARLIEAMESAGIVGGMGNNGQRDVLVPSSRN